jgi:hypothetical protein
MQYRQQTRQNEPDRQQEHAQVIRSQPSHFEFPFFLRELFMRVKAARLFISLFWTEAEDLHPAHPCESINVYASRQLAFSKLEHPLNFDRIRSTNPFPGTATTE